MPLNLGNLTAVTASEEELLLTSAEHDLALMDALRELENCSNALEIVQKAKQTSSMECMNFAEELLGAQVSEEELVAALEAAETKTFDALRASFNDAKNIFDMYKKKLEGLNPNTVVKDPSIIRTLLRQIKQAYPFVSAHMKKTSEKDKARIGRFLDMIETASSGTNVRSINAILNFYQQCLNLLQAIINTPMGDKMNSKWHKEGADKLYPLVGTCLRLVKAGMRKLYYTAKNSKETDGGELSKGAKFVTRAGNIAMRNAL